MGKCLLMQVSRRPPPPKWGDCLGAGGAARARRTRREGRREAGREGATERQASSCPPCRWLRALVDLVMKPPSTSLGIACSEEGPRMRHGVCCSHCLPGEAPGPVPSSLGDGCWVGGAFCGVVASLFHSYLGRLFCLAGPAPVPAAGHAERAHNGLCSRSPQSPKGDRQGRTCHHHESLKGLGQSGPN